MNRTFINESIRFKAVVVIAEGFIGRASEFPVEAQARTVLGAIGQGERTFSLITREAGGLNPGSYAWTKASCRRGPMRSAATGPAATARRSTLAVARSGCTATGVIALGPGELLDCWRRTGR
jgi:hypothetical protein